MPDKKKTITPILIGVGIAVLASIGLASARKPPETKYSVSISNIGSEVI